MKGWILVDPAAVDDDGDLRRRVHRGRDFAAAQLPK